MEQGEGEKRDGEVREREIEMDRQIDSERDRGTKTQRTRST